MTKPRPAQQRQFTCLICGRQFWGDSQPKRYCSAACAAKVPRKSRAKPKIPRQCVQCGRPFTPARGHAQTCSTRCRVAAHRRRQRSKA
jgi:hypothetical protein